MRRWYTLEAAIAALLIANPGLAARAQAPPTPIRLVDVQSRPVAGAIVGTYLRYDRDREPSFTPREPAESRTSDERGEASLALISWSQRNEAGIYAIRQDKDGPLVGVAKVTRKESGRPITIVMHPACRVRLRIECPGFRELESKYHAELDGPTWERSAHVILGDEVRS